MWPRDYRGEFKYTLITYHPLTNKGKGETEMKEQEAPNAKGQVARIMDDIGNILSDYDEAWIFLRDRLSGVLLNWDGKDETELLNTREDGLVPLAERLADIRDNLAQKADQIKSLREQVEL